MSSQPIQISWKGNKQFLATSSAGHKVLMDGPPSAGGLDAGTRPMEMLLMGLAGCASFDVVTILQKKKANLISLDVNVTATRKDQIPAVFEHIVLAFKISASGVSEVAVEKAVNLSLDKYCSVAAMLRAAGVEIEANVTFIEE
ncbi:OsmC family protein [Catenovulum sp. SX2]|uniref:OsmC family protein n=1 Tax=Catenovulum sp. SX2 TaxID=3398614 RepID=UPI003F87A105